MIKPNLTVVEKLMHSVSGSNDLNAFPFQPADVDGIFTHKIDEGHGVWFHLRDGRVFDSYGRPSESAVTQYGEVRAQIKWSQ